MGRHGGTQLRNPIKIIDRGQQAFAPAAFLYGVVKKFGDDSAGSLAALIAYYGFAALFPLFLVFFTVLGLLAANSSLAHSISNSAVSQFPLIGPQLKNNIHTLHSGSVIGLVIGILFSTYGALGVSQAGQKAMAGVWNIPGVKRPGYLPRMARSLGFLLVLVVDVLLTTGLSSLSTFGLHVAFFHNIGFKVGIEVLTFIINIGVYWAAFRVLTPAEVATRDLLPGAVLGGVAWTILQGAGVYLVGHNVRNAGQVYGTFAVVLGLLAWLYLAAQISLYAAELNVVLRDHLWPRSIVQPPLTDADKQVLNSIALEGARRPEQTVSSTFDDAASDSDTGTGEVLP